MPKESRRTFTTGARQLVVQEALEMMWWDPGSYLSSFTPRTMVMSSFFPGARDDDLPGPGFKVLGRPVPVPELPGGLHHHVHPQVLPGKLGGSRSEKTFISSPSTIRPASEGSTVPG